MDFDGNTIANALTGLFSALAGAGGAVMAMRKRASSDELQIDRDKRERSVMSDLQHERDLWHTEVQRQREQMDQARQAIANAEMRAQVAQGDLTHMHESYRRLHRRAQRMANRLVQAGLMDPAEAGDLYTRFGELDELPPAPDKKP